MAAFNSMPAMPAASAVPSDAMGLNHGPPQSMNMDSFDPELNFHESLLYVPSPSFPGLGYSQDRCIAHFPPPLTPYGLFATDSSATRIAMAVRYHLSLLRPPMNSKTLSRLLKIRFLTRLARSSPSPTRMSRLTSHHPRSWTTSSWGSLIRLCTRA